MSAWHPGAGHAACADYGHPFRLEEERVIDRLLTGFRSRLLGLLRPDGNVLGNELDRGEDRELSDEQVRTRQDAIRREAAARRAQSESVRRSASKDTDRTGQK